MTSIQGSQQLPPPVVYVQRPGRGMAVSALVLGIVGVCIASIPLLGFFAIPMGIVGFVLGLAGVRKAKREGGGKAMPQGRWDLSAAAVAVAIFAAVAYTSAANDFTNDFHDCYTLHNDQAACARLNS